MTGPSIRHIQKIVTVLSFLLCVISASNAYALPEYAIQTAQSSSGQLSSPSKRSEMACWSCLASQARRLNQEARE